ncbi:MAG: calcium-binding protein [Cyanobacteriota bacterium]
MATIYGTGFNDNGTYQFTYGGEPSSIRFFPRLRGTALADKIYGLKGDDILQGEGGDDELFGGQDNDILEGGAGNDTLTGAGFYPASYNPDGSIFYSPAPGNNEIDQLTGGAGADIFVLGDANRIYYDDGYDPLIWFDQGEGNFDYALITDFTDGQDRIQLKGGETYQLVENTEINGVRGIGIYVDKGSTFISVGGSMFGGFSIPRADELIGIIQGATLSELQIVADGDIKMIV